jgi:PAS domain S-box-containing protein
MINTTASNDQLENALVSDWLKITDTGCCVLDGGSHVLMMNEVAGHLLGVDPFSILGQPAGQILTALNDSVALRILLQPTGLDGQTKVSRKTEKGKVELLIKARWTERLGSERYRVISITDITELMQANEELAVQHRQWQAMNAGVVLVSVEDADQPIVFVNPAFEALTGYSAQECIGRNCRFLQGSLRDQPGLKDIRDAVLNKRNGYGLLRNFRKDGSEFANELFISPIHNASGKLTHFLGVQHLRMPDAHLPA